MSIMVCLAILDMCCYCHHEFARQPVQLGPEIMLVLTTLRIIKLALMLRSIQSPGLGGHERHAEIWIQTLVTVSPTSYPRCFIVVTKE